MNRELADFSLRVLIAWSIGGLLITVLLLLWSGADVWLLVFAGLLLALLLRGVSEWIARMTGLPTPWSLGVLLLTSLVVTLLGGWLIGSSVAEQFGELSERLPRAADPVKSRLEEQRRGREVLSRLPDPDRFLSGRGVVVSRVTGAATGALGAIGSAVVVLFIGIFVAVEPGAYRRGLLRLVPLRGRPRGEQVLDSLGETLRGWLTGKAFSMTVVGVMTAIGLWALGIPLALPLGIVTALLSFIPNIGPLLALIPALLIALPEGPIMAVYVLVLFTAIQTVESYLLTPLVQRNLIAMPPALIISAQVLLGVLLGGVGVLIATPLTAGLIVLVRMLYVEDILGDSDPEASQGEGR